MIIVIGMEKGGDGKSTVATNLATLLAIEGKDVLLIDSDPQGSSYLWNAIRDEDTTLPKITCFQKFGRVRDERCNFLAIMPGKTYRYLGTEYIGIWAQ